MKNVYAIEGPEHEKLLARLREHNIFLTNGKLNTRYKILFKTHLNLEITSKADVMNLLFPSILPICAICGLSTKRFLGVVNLQSPLASYRQTCSDLCAHRLKSASLIDFLKKQPDARVHRAAKFRKRMAQIIDGETLASKTAKKAAFTKQNKFKDGKSLMAIQMLKIRKVKEQKGSIVPQHLLSDFILYRRSVKRYTEKQPLSQLKNIERRGHFNNGGQHLDHRHSIFEAFKNGLPANVAGSIVNLEIIPASKNSAKGRKSSLTCADLIIKYFDYTVLKQPLKNSYD